MTGPRSPTADAALLKRVPHFGALPAVELGRLAARCSSRTLRRGEVLFEEGQPCRGLFIIVKHEMGLPPYWTPLLVGVGLLVAGAIWSMLSGKSKAS